MIAGHFATALIAHQRFPKGSLLFFLIVSQFQDFLWFILYYFGLETTEPSDVLDATVGNMTVMLTYSHHLVPQLIWGSLIFVVGRVAFKSTEIGLVAVAIFAGHFVLDFLSGHPHHIFGADTHQVGLGLYASGIYSAILIEFLFVSAALWFFFKRETQTGIVRTFRNRAVVVGVFGYGLVFLLVTAKTSTRQWFDLPLFDLGFNTMMPTLIIMYATMTFVLHRSVVSSRSTNSMSDG